jgi:osmoprotectant transport system ATP-binding protein
MISLEAVGKRFGGRDAVAGVTLRIDPGALCVLVGPSGAGKSTVLRMINALVPADRGAIRIDGRDIRDIEPTQLRRGIGYVIQSIGLFPHWTVAQNIGTVPRLLEWPADRIARRVHELADLLQLDADLLGRYPHQLSGGQQQRVGVARALAGDPGIVLMDEPFGALDPITRETLQGELARIHRRTGKTIVFVTHDMDEALRLGTQIAVLEGGRLVQQGAPRALLQVPANDFVRQFVGGAELGLRQLHLTPVRERVSPGTAEGEPIAADASLKQAMSLMVASGRRALPVRDSDGRALGIVRLEHLVQP